MDLYNSASGTWSTAELSIPRTGFAATSVGNVAIFAGGRRLFSVDLYNSASDTWSTESISWSSRDLAATSVSKVAIFAGGITSNRYLALCYGVVVNSTCFARMMRVEGALFVALSFLRCRRLPSDDGYCRYRDVQRCELVRL